MIKGINKGDTVQMLVKHPYRTIVVRGKVFQQNADQIRLDVSSPPAISVITISQAEQYGNIPSAFEGYTWKWMGEVAQISVVKYRQPKGQIERATDGGDFDF